MTYIIFAAGKGKRLQPLTLKYAKTQYKLDTNTTILQRMVRKIRKYDKRAEIVIITGYKWENIQNELETDNVKIVLNPFYAVTSSVASLWFAKDYLEKENVVLINGDIVLSDEIIERYICVPTKKPYLLLDSSASEDDKYYVQINGNKVVVLSKELSEYYAEYCHVVKLDAVSARLLKQEIIAMVRSDMYDQYFESALVQLIFSTEFELYYEDIAGYEWVEVDEVNDMLKAKNIHKKSLIVEKNRS